MTTPRRHNTWKRDLRLWSEYKQMHEEHGVRKDRVIASLAAKHSISEATVRKRLQIVRRHLKQNNDD